MDMRHKHQGGSLTDASGLDTLKIAQAWQHARAARARVMGYDLFGEPAWDILLDLYQAHCLNHTLYVSQLGLVERIPHSSVLRWIDLLERNGLVTRQKDSRDGRRVIPALTPLAVEQLEAALRAAAESDRASGLGRLSLVERSQNNDG
jgi:DNA-binding MarR family transcriptional regulator